MKKEEKKAIEQQAQEEAEELKPIDEIVYDAPGKDALTKDDIERGLAKLPAMIANQARKVAQARELKDKLVIQLKVAMARCIVQNESIKKCNATDKKAYAELNTQIEAEEVAHAEYLLTLEEIILKSYENYFTSIRKQAYFTLIEMEKLGGAISRRYGDEDNQN